MSLTVPRVSPAPPATRWQWKQRSVLPGFGLTLGYSLTYLSLLVLLPLSALFAKAATAGPTRFWEIATSERTLAALKVSFGGAAIAATVSCVFGFVVAWVLARYEFPGKKLVDAVVDLPFAMPTAVSGIALASLFGPNGWFGKPLGLLGLQTAQNFTGVLIALTFISFPFVVRTVQPALEEVEAELEEAAASLGAGWWARFRRVIFPVVLPALLTGYALAVARAIGEYGSVIFIASNIPLEDEIAPKLIIERLGEYDYAGATVVGVIMLLLSFVLLLAVNLLQVWSARRLTGGR